MTTNEEYIFWIIPDLAEKPRSYLIYQATDKDRKNPIALAVFEDRDYYEIFNMTDRGLTNLEELNISIACEKFRFERYFPNLD